MSYILVVDDDRDVRDFVAESLRQEGYRVETASNGHEALERLRQEPSSLILLDLMMPVMDGNELVERLRSDPDTATIPIMSLTSNPDSSVGADLVVSKFPAPSELVAVVRSVMGGDK